LAGIRISLTVWHYLCCFVEILLNKASWFQPKKKVASFPSFKKQSKDNLPEVIESIRYVWTKPEIDTELRQDDVLIVMPPTEPTPKKIKKKTF